MRPLSQAVVDPVRVRTLPSLRGWFVAAQLAGHGLALALWWSGWPWLALLTVVVTHLLAVWGHLYPHSRLFGPLARRLGRRDQAVWLTFDDGPSPDTPALLDLLDRHGAKATFFLVAERAAREPALVADIVRRGHGIGNHTWSHPSAWFWFPSPSATRRQIGLAQRELTRLAGRSPRWFRSVAGHTNPFVQPALAALGLRRVSWSGRGLETVDGDDERVLRRLSAAIAPGAILVLHENVGPGRCPRLLARLLDELARRGCRTVLPD